MKTEGYKSTEESAQIRRAFFWNMLSTVTYASMSFLMLLAVVRICGTERGGVFSIAFSTSQMLQTAAFFGMRNFQATDINRRFLFSHYNSSRLITSLLMAACCLLYAFFMRFEGEKLAVFLLFCGVKLCEALADVLEGMMQQHNRLDRASQALFLRTLLIIAVFIAALLAGLPLAAASLFSLLAAAAGLLLFSFLPARKYEPVSLSPDIRAVSRLLLECLPLFAAAASWAYLTNAPKIAIDLNMNDQAQAEFAIIFMPAMLINMFSGFVFRPLLNTMAVCFVSGDKKRFSGLIRRLVWMDTGVTLLALAGTWLLGVPILNWVYGVDISHLKGELLLIILGGGGCALVNLLCQTLTVIRQQVRILSGYLLTTALTLAASNLLVKNEGIWGAALLYFLSMALLALILLILYAGSMKKFYTPSQNETEVKNG